VSDEFSYFFFSFFPIDEIDFFSYTRFLFSFHSSFLRHPAYTGWFYWAVGTQVLLSNPICAIIYAYASWRFFSARIPYEEDLLDEFYPEYSIYAGKTYIMIPFIKSKLKHK
jgi:protein-S-isoprenylcysteine O-methyltransferase Ste14